MILVFAPYPALERVALVDQFEAGQAARKPRVQTFAGGPGLRAATAARLLGGDVLALTCAGGHLGALLQDGLDKQDVPHILTPIAADTRGDFLLLDKERGVITAIPEDAPPLLPAESEKLLASLARHVKSAALLLIAGGTEENAVDLFAQAITQSKEADVPVLADLKGEGLEAAIAAGVWLIRANIQTLQKRTERSLQHDSAIIEEARSLIAQGTENVVVTLGEEGALLVTAEGAWRVKAPVVSHFNPTGCGETLSGAVAAWWARTGDLVEAVRWGCAAASVNVTHDEPGYATPGETAILFSRTVAGPVIVR